MEPTPQQKAVYEHTLMGLLTVADNFRTALRLGSPIARDNETVIMHKVSLVVAAHREQSMVGTVSESLLSLDGEFNDENPDPRPALAEKVSTLEKDLNDELVSLGFNAKEIKDLMHNLGLVNQAATLVGRGDGLNYIINLVPNK